MSSSKLKPENIEDKKDKKDKKNKKNKKTEKDVKNVKIKKEKKSKKLQEAETRSKNDDTKDKEQEKYKDTPFNIVDKLDENDRKEFENEGKGGKGIVLLDLAFFVPFNNPEDFDVQFGIVQDKSIDSLNGKKNSVVNREDFKLNHRYSNRNIFTISKKNGRKISKLGYPVIVDLKERQLLLKIVLTYHDSPVTLFFPLMINLSEDNPFATLLLKFDAGNAEIVFATTKFFSADDKIAKIRHKYYSNRKIEIADEKRTEIIYFKRPIKVPNTKNALVYSDFITLFSNPILINI